MSSDNVMLFSPLSVRGVAFKNRIALPPMCQWLSDAAGHVKDYHLAHYGARALAGTGLIIVEATAVEARGRITDHDLGLWSDAHVEGLARLAAMISAFGTVPGIQLGHAGRKAWALGPEVIGASPVAFSEKYKTPREMTTKDIETVVDSFAQGAVRAVKAGFKVLEMHSAHGYLMHQFLSPLSNKRTDEFGGSLENRLRFPLMITREIRKAVPAGVVVLPRVSAAEYDAHGYTLSDMEQICVAYCEAGADMIHVSSGGSVPVAPPSWPGYQLPLAKAVRQALLAKGHKAPVIGVGKLDDASLAEYALQEGYCDMVAVGRAMLKNPNWPSLAAASLGAEPPIVEPLKSVFVPVAK